MVSGFDCLCLAVDWVYPDTVSDVREGERLNDMERSFSFFAALRRVGFATVAQVLLYNGVYVDRLTWIMPLQQYFSR